MDALDYIRSAVTEQTITCDVLREDNDSAYSSEPQKVDEVDVAIFAPSASSQVVVEGSGEDTSLSGYVVPETDTDGNMVEYVTVNDMLRPQSNTERLYTVRTKVGRPNELDPDLWELGLERANASQ